MSPSSILKFILAALVFAGATVCINSVQREMNSIKKEAKLTDTDPVDNAPPVIAFTTVALGSFRGLLADFLWLRASNLQERGQYFEMAQIASWITKLQPRFTGATAYLAWNMAYNISVACSDHRDRWRWVRKGIELIRDEALEYNPSDPNLYKELGWIYQHKIGNIMDDANMYYKQQMALEYMKVFGGPEPDFDSLLAAPADDGEFKKRFPASDKLWTALEKAGYKNMAALSKDFRSKGFLPEKFTKSLDDAAEEKALDSYLRRKWLVETYKLDPAFMLELNRKYGAFDWRLPESHAIYWATLGLRRSKLSEREINNDRMITQSLKEAFMGGRLLMVDKNSPQTFMTAPNLKLTDAVIASLKEAFQIHKSQSFRNAALRNFMVDAAVINYTFGGYKKAEELQKELIKEYPEDNSYKGDLDTFILNQWMEDVKSATVKQMMDIMQGLLFRSCQMLAYGEYDSAATYNNMAKRIYAFYKKDHADNWQRTGLPSLPEISARIVKACLENFPPEMAKSLEKELKNIKIEKEDEAADEKTKKEER